MSDLLTLTIVYSVFMFTLKPITNFLLSKDYIRGLFLIETKPLKNHFSIRKDV